MSAKAIIGLLLVGVLTGAPAGCGPRPAGTALNDSQTLLYEGDALGYPVRIRATADGRLAVLEAYGQDLWVKFFSKDGQYLGGAVPKGPGPKEMRGAWTFVEGPDDSLRVLDIASRRIVTVTDEGVAGSWPLPDGMMIRTILRNGELLAINWFDDAAFGRYRDSEATLVGRAPGADQISVFRRQEAYDGPWLTLGDTLIRAHHFAPQIEFWDLTTNKLVGITRAPDHDWQPFTDAEAPLIHRRAYSAIAVHGDSLIGLSGWGDEMPEATRLEVFSVRSGEYLGRIELAQPVIGLTSDGDYLYSLVYEPWPGIVKMDLHPGGRP